MGKEATSATPKRTTRSSLATTTPPKTSLQTERTAKILSPSMSNDLLFREEPISLDDLVCSIPGRQTQMIEILQLIGPLNSPMIPLFLYGGASTGKTSVILQIFKHLNRPFVYSSCRSCHNSRALFETVLNQLLFHRRNSSNGYSSAMRCERASDFINLLKDTLIQVLDRIKEIPKKSGMKEPTRQGDGKMIYLIFDNVERIIRHWDKKSSILSLLFKLYDILKIPEVGLIYISSASPDKYYTDTGSIEHIPVFFPDYTEDNLYQIFMENQANPLLYSTFLKVVLKFFYRVTRRVDELAIALEPLFQKYCEPLSDLGLVPDESMKRRLFDNIYPHIAPSSDEIFKVSSWSSLGADYDKTFSRKRNSRNSVGGEASAELDFHMSVSAKYLLISAFLASRNPATLDAAIFDSTGGSSNKKRRKSSETTIQQKENKAQEMLMKGPGNFSLERLLAIFQCITSVEDYNFEDCLEDGLNRQGGDIGLMSDVLLQLSTLCNANFIVKSGSCPLEGSTRYRSTVDEEMALKVARSINFPLSKYLYRR